MKRLLPHPLLSLALLVMWLLLNQSLAPAHILFGAVLGVTLAWGMVALEPEAPRIKRPLTIVQLFGAVVVDILRSNIAVATIILRRKNHEWTSGFVRIPLDLRDRNGLAVLACIITATPGTIWVNYDAAKDMLLIHVLDLIDEAEWIHIIKQHYERPLMDIFE